MIILPRRRQRPVASEETPSAAAAACLSCRCLSYLQPSFFLFFSICFIYKILYKILFSISYFSPTILSKSYSLYIKPYIRNIFCFKFLYVRIYHTSNTMDIFYFYLIQCLKRKEKIEKRGENLYIEEICSVFYFRGPFRERCWRNRERNLLYIYIAYIYIYMVENGSEGSAGDSIRRPRVQRE
jgi:hypothetical protein